MNKVISYIAGGVAVVALIVAITASNKVPERVMGSTGPQGPKGERGIQGPQGERGLQGPAGRDGKAVLGAVTGPDSYLPYVANNNVREYSYSKNLATGTSTVCSFKTPAATTTLRHAAIRFTLASSTATVLDIAKDTSFAATTTKIGSTYAIAAGAQATIVASTTGSVAGDATLFAPSTYLNFKIGPTTGDGAGHAATGLCNAVFTGI